MALNAGFVAVLAGRAPDFRAGVALARAALRERGRRCALLRQLACATGGDTAGGGMSFLDDIRPLKLAEAARLREAFAAAPPRRPDHRPLRDFRAALQGGRRLIAEIKGRAPSHPDFALTAPVDRVARAYRRGGAAALSLVTDRTHFGTGLDGPGRRALGRPAGHRQGLRAGSRADRRGLGRGRRLRAADRALAGRPARWPHCWRTRAAWVWRCWSSATTSATSTWPSAPAPTWWA